MSDAPKRGIILFGHGSRDPSWRQPMEAVAARIETVDAQASVVCAYLELTTPDLPTAAGALIAEGARALTVVPMFLGVGKHAREDLPLLLARLRDSHPQVEFTLQPAIGEDPRLIDLIARMALEPRR